MNLGTFAAGDLAIVEAYRNGNITPPSLPAGWTNIVSNGGANTNSARIGYRVLQAGDANTGTWTNATNIQVHVLRGQDTVTPIGASAEAGSNASPVTLPALTLQITDGTSWVLCLVGAKGTGTNAITVTTAPALTLRSGANTNLGAHSANGVTTFAGNTYDTQPATSNVYRAASVEIRAAAAVRSLVFQPRTARNPLLRR